MDVKPGLRVGEYVVDELIGSGSFGDVWKARHHVWADRVVAVKVPRDVAYLRWLQREGRAIHALRHPNIVAALAFDPYADVPYLAMEYVPGFSLRPLVGTLAPAAAAEAVAQVLAALDFAHRGGVIHRDVKPENVLVHEDLFVRGAGTPGAIRLTDFGLGKVPAGAGGSIQFSQDLSASQAGGVVGSLDYMSPEQRAGAAVDARTDLYAAGVLLFELLTGHKPQGHELPSDLNPSLGTGFDEVFRGAYARLDRRYASAAEMLAALRQASGVTGVPPSDAAAFPAWVNAERAENAKHASPTRRLALFRERTFSARGVMTAAAFSPDGDGIAAASDSGVAVVWNVRTGDPFFELRGHRGAVNAVEFSPDGGRLLTASHDRTARIWDARGGQCVAELTGHGQHVYAAAFSSDGLKVATGSDDGSARLWDAATGAWAGTLSPHPGWVTAVRFNPVDATLATTCADGQVRLWDTTRRRPIWAAGGHAGCVTSADFAPGGRRLVTGSIDRTARVFDLSTGSQLAVMAGHTEWVTATRFSPDGRLVLTGSKDHTARLWDAATGVELGLARHDAPVWGVGWHPSGRQFAAAAADGTVQVWALQ